MKKYITVHYVDTVTGEPTSEVFTEAEVRSIGRQVAEKGRLTRYGRMAVTGVVSNMNPRERRVSALDR